MKNQNELTIFDLHSIVWRQKKCFVIVNICIWIVGILLYVAKPKVDLGYRSQALVEIGRYLAVNGDSKVFEAPSDVAAIVGKLYGVEAMLVPGTNKILQLSCTDLNPEKSNQTIENSLKYIERRHYQFLKGYDRKSISYVEPTNQIGNVETSIVVAQSLSNIKRIIIVILVGIFFSLTAVIIRDRRSNYLKSGIK